MKRKLRTGRKHESIAHGLSYNTPAPQPSLKEAEYTIEILDAKFVSLLFVCRRAFLVQWFMETGVHVLNQLPKERQVHIFRYTSAAEQHDALIF